MRYLIGDCNKLADIKDNSMYETDNSLIEDYFSLIDVKSSMSDYHMFLKTCEEGYLVENSFDFSRFFIKEDKPRYILSPSGSTLDFYPPRVLERYMSFVTDDKYAYNTGIVLHLEKYNDYLNKLETVNIPSIIFPEKGMTVGLLNVYNVVLIEGFVDEIYSLLFSGHYNAWNRLMKHTGKVKNISVRSCMYIDSANVELDFGKICVESEMEVIVSCNCVIKIDFNNSSCRRMEFNFRSVSARHKVTIVPVNARGTAFSASSDKNVQVIIK